MFYTFKQNNSGGFFVGPHYIIVEASSIDEANVTGCANGVNPLAPYCKCCGPRWAVLEDWKEEDATPYPAIYGIEVTESAEIKIVRKGDQKP